jgi:hypothetical protein
MMANVTGAVNESAPIRSVKSGSTTSITILSEDLLPQRNLLLMLYSEGLVQKSRRWKNPTPQKDRKNTLAGLLIRH